MRRLLVVACMACAAAACRKSKQPQPAPPTLVRTGPVVVFTRDRIAIDQLDTAVHPPVTVGSQPSPAMLASDAPDVVTVAPDGGLVAHRAGTAIVRSVNGGQLTVDVRPIAKLAIDPPRIQIRPGGELVLRLVDPSSGSEIPAGAAQWLTRSPEIAAVDAGLVRAGRRAGTTQIMARYGGRSVIAVVVVAGKRDGHEPSSAKAIDKRGDR